MTSTEVRTDDQLQQIVQDELDWSAEVGSVAIRVAAPVRTRVRLFVDGDDAERSALSG